MANRTEVIKTNCPACGCGLIVDVDGSNTIAVGDQAKKPENPAGQPEDQKEVSSSSDEKGSVPDPEPDSGETPEDEQAGTGSDEADEDSPEDPAEETEDLGLGGW